MSNARFGRDVVIAGTHPPYEGGPLPEWARDAGWAWRTFGAQGLARLAAALGPLEQVDVTWHATGRDNDLPFDDWRARVRGPRGAGTLHVTFGGGSGGAVPPAGSGKFVDELAAAAQADHVARQAKLASGPARFLVTGASGNLGKAVVAALRARGDRVRALVRRVPEQAVDGVSYALGNLGDPEAVARAVAGVEVVIHVGAATRGGWPEHRVGTVVGTENVVAACRAHGVQQLVYVSSMSVIDWAGTAARGGTVDETAALEPRPEERGPYTRAKLAAEQIVARAGLPCVILRPGQIFGRGMPLINGAVARAAAGRAWLVLGDGGIELPLVYVDDVVDAILAAVDRGLVGGEVIQLIDPEHLTQREVLALAGGGKPVIAVPRPIVFALGKLSELPMKALGKASPIAAYRLRSALARLHYGSPRARALLGWIPKVGVREGIRRVSS